MQHIVQTSLARLYAGLRPCVVVHLMLAVDSWLYTTFLVFTLEISSAASCTVCLFNFALAMDTEPNSNTMLSKRRARMLPETLEKLMFLRYRYVQ